MSLVPVDVSGLRLPLRTLPTVLILGAFLLTTLGAAAETFGETGRGTAFGTAFVFPDHILEAYEKFFAGANSSLFVASYMFTSGAIAGLIEKEKRARPWLNISILIEGVPVGGVTSEEKEILCRLGYPGRSTNASAPARVLLYNGTARYMHAKYIVADDSGVLVTTENLVDSALSGNRGWGTILDDDKLAAEFLNVFFEDAGAASDVHSLCEAREMNASNDTNGTNAKEGISDIGSDGGAFSPREFAGADARAIFAPAATDDIIGIIGSANRSIYVAQFSAPRSWARRDNPLLDALLSAARRGLEVRVLLDGSYYNKKENGETVAWLNLTAAEEELDIRGRLFDGKHLDLEKAHTKGMIIDNTTVLVSSINWNQNSLENNREAGVLIHSDVAAAFFADVFAQDWNAQDRAPAVKVDAVKLLGAAGAFLIVGGAAAKVFKRI